MTRISAYFVAAIIIVQIPIYFDFGFGESEVNHSVIWSEGEENRAIVDVEIKNGRFLTNYTAVAFPTPVENNDPKAITLIQDDNLDSSCYEDSVYYQSRVWGIWDHLSSEIEYRKMPNNFELKNSVDFFEEKESGFVIFPYSDVSEESQRNELLGWVREGGVLFTMADFFSNLASWEGENGDLDPLMYPEQILNNPERSFGFTDSNISKAFNLGYPQSTHGISHSQLIDLEGFSLGPGEDGSDFSAISFVPIGRGALIHFGGCMTNIKWFTDENQISHDIATMIGSGLVESLANSSFKSNSATLGDLVFTQLSMGPREKLNISINLDFDQRFSRGVKVFTYSSSMHNRVVKATTSKFHNTENFDRSSLREGNFEKPSHFIEVQPGEISVILGPQLYGEFEILAVGSQNEKREMSNISIFWGNDFFPICNDGATIGRFVDELTKNLQENGHKVSSIDSETDLVDFLMSNPKGNLVMAGSVFPESVHSSENSTMNEWLVDGGLLIWIGQTIGALSSSVMGSEIAWGDEQNLRWEGVPHILGGQFIDEGIKEEYPLSSNEINVALGIDFSSIRLSPYLERIEPTGGFAIGASAAEIGRSSVSFVQVESGAAIIFGDCIGPNFSPNSYDSVAEDVSVIIQSGIIREARSNNSLVFSHSTESPRFVSSSSSFQLSGEIDYLTLVVRGENFFQVTDFNISE